jgi:hypothetical protein
MPTGRRKLALNAGACNLDDRDTSSWLRAWQAERIADGVGVGAIDKARTLLSSVLRHAAESAAIAGNPMGLVRPPLAEHRDAVRPLAPVTVEGVRAVFDAPCDCSHRSRQISLTRAPPSAGRPTRYRS